MTMQVSLKNFQEIVHPFNVYEYPLVDFISDLSYIKLASLYPSYTCGYVIIY